MKNGIELITQERQEQMEVHGFNLPHDKEENTYGQLTGAAACLLTNDRNLFPRDWDLKCLAKFEGKSRIEQLTIAGALIAAEIDRLQALKN